MQFLMRWFLLASIESGASLPLNRPKGPTEFNEIVCKAGHPSKLSFETRRSQAELGNEEKLNHHPELFRVHAFDTQATRLVIPAPPWFELPRSLDATQPPSLRLCCPT